MAVDKVTLDLTGGICALVGPNGAGKSTLLKLLTGLLTADEGSVEVAGLEIPRQALDLKRITGVVPEDLGLFDALTVEEHLELCGPIYGLNMLETRRRMGDLLRLLDLEGGRRTFLDQCSHGMRKKTALAMALLHNPRVLFLDEPFEGVDPASSRAIQALLASIAGRGVTVFLTSHILSIVDRLATDVLLIRGGSIVWRSESGVLTRPLEDLYFELVETPRQEDLAWLGFSPS